MTVARRERIIPLNEAIVIEEAAMVRESVRVRLIFFFGYSINFFILVAFHYLGRYLEKKKIQPKFFGPLIYFN